MDWRSFYMQHKARGGGWWVAHRAFPVCDRLAGHIWMPRPAVPALILSLHRASSKGIWHLPARLASCLELLRSCVGAGVQAHRARDRALLHGGWGAHAGAGPGRGGRCRRCTSATRRGSWVAVQCTVVSQRRCGAHAVLLLVLESNTPRCPSRCHLEQRACRTPHSVEPLPEFLLLS